MKDHINVNDRIEKAQTHTVKVTAEFMVITPIESRREGAEAMVARLVQGALQELSPAKNMVGDVAVFLRVTGTRPVLEAPVEVPEKLDVLDEFSEAEPEQPQVQTRRDDSAPQPEQQKTPATPASARVRVDSWREEENKIVRLYYPKGGVERVRRELRKRGFDRTDKAISSRASKINASPGKRSGLTPAGREVMRIISDVGAATVPELLEFSEIDGKYTYYQVMYGLRKAEQGGFVKGRLEPNDNGTTIRWDLTAAGRSMSYTNGGNGERTEEMDSGGSKDSQAHLPEARV